MTQIAAAVVRRQIIVEALIERAFTVFTERYGDFKAAGAQPARSGDQQTVFEPQSAATSTTAASTAPVPLGADLPQPPNRVVFSWDIGPQWQVETEPDNTSQVEIPVCRETPQRTRMELEHRNIDRHGPGWEGVSEAVAATPDGRCT